MEEQPQIIRIALHPRDPHKALKDQKEIIYKLKDQGYKILSYREVIYLNYKDYDFQYSRKNY
jgi:hypothetical protein